MALHGAKPVGSRPFGAPVLSDSHGWQRAWFQRHDSFAAAEAARLTMQGNVRACRDQHTPKCIRPRFHPYRRYDCRMKIRERLISYDS